MQSIMQENYSLPNTTTLLQQLDTIDNAACGWTRFMSKVSCEKTKEAQREKKRSSNVYYEKKKETYLIENTQEYKLIHHNLWFTQGAQMSLLSFSNVGFCNAVGCVSVPK